MTKPPPIFHARGVVRFVTDRATDIRTATLPSELPPEARGSEKEPGGDDQRLEALASLIAGSATEPAWLRSGLERATRSVRFCRLAEMAHPDRVPLRKQLTEIRDLLAALASKLDDKSVIATMDAIDATDRDDADGAFEWLKATWRAAVAGQPIVAKAIEAVPFGRTSKTKYYPLLVESPLLCCAVFVRLAWESVHHSQVPHTGAEAQAACVAMWRLARGGAQDFQKGDLNPYGWRKYLDQAKRLPETSLAQYKVVLRRP